MTTLADAPRPVLPLVTVAVHEDLDLSSQARVGERLTEALALRPDRLVVDLSRCGFLDATGLTVLLHAHRDARRQGAELVLRGPQARAVRVIALAGLSGVFTVERAA